MAKQSRDDRSKAIEFRLSRSEPVILVAATVDGHGPFRFILDTGASTTILSPFVARQAGVTAKARARAASAYGSQPVGLGRVRTLSVGDAEARNLRVAILSLAYLNRTTRLRIGGILGYNFLRRFRITIDYPSRRLFLAPPAPPEEEAAARPAKRRRSPPKG